jgi:hypothetical protein
MGSCEMLWRPNSPKGYMMRRPNKMILDKKLAEISGIYYLTTEKKLIAIADDKKKIYSLTTKGEAGDYFDPELPSADFEDVVRVDSTIYTLISDGTVIATHKTDSGLVTINHPFPSTGKNDFETMYYEPEAKGVIILCKSCAAEKGKNERTAFRFDIATKKFDPTPYYIISSKSVKDILKDGKVEFKPSAAAIHPVEKNLYILSSAGQLLVITDRKGKVQSAYRLNPTFYPQAEGIAFAENGDMYISNEAKLGKPTLLHLPYKPQKK